MPSAAAPEGGLRARGGWLAPAALAVAAVTALRLWGLWHDQKDLFVDESQYWLWGQSLEWGYFSKPPLIGWVIRASTGIAGSDAPFWVRAPAPLLHGLTALLLGALAARLAGRATGRATGQAAALWTVAVYLTMPLVAVGSLLMTTDTVMFPCLAGALLAWLMAIERRSPVWGALAGALVGVGFLAKYAAIYYLGCALLAALLVPRARPSGAVALAGGLAFLAAISPNLLWNLQNGLITLQHTVDNADWARDPASRLALRPDRLAEFAGAQVFVFGPLLLPALVWMGARWRRVSGAMRVLLLFSLPIVALICAQALVSRAYANWAAAAYLAGAVAVALHLGARAPRWLAAGVALNGALSLGLALVVALPDRAPEAVRAAVMDRYTGRVALSRAILRAAEREGLPTVVSENRDVLADLFHTGRESPVAIRAVPVPGRPPHHFAMRYPFEGGAPALYVGGPEPPPCGAVPLGQLAPPGYWSGRPRQLWRVPGDCWGMP